MELSERDDTGHGYAAVRVLPTIRQYWQQDLRRVVNLHSLSLFNVSIGDG